MIWIVAYLSSVLGALLTLVAMTIIRNDTRHNVGRLGWMGLILLTPPIGLLLFLWLGGRKISAEHASRRLVDLPKDDEEVPDHGDGFESLLQSRGLRPPTIGNEFEILTEVHKVYDAYLDMIDQAQEAIYVMTFIMDERESSEEIVERLCRKARDGVQVRLLCDGFGSFQMSDDQLEAIREAGGKARRFKPLSKLSRLAYLNYRNHRKLMVVDGKMAILGGANLVQEEIAEDPPKDAWVDLSVRIEGPAAAQLQAVFCSDWNFVTDETLPPSKIETPAEGADCESSRLTVVPIGPDGPEEILEDFWQYSIHQAEHRVWICTPYLVPSPSAMRSLELACRRGLDVRLLVPSRSDLWPVDYARYDYMKDLIEVGAKLYRYTDGMVHAKVGLVDDEVALVGSANFDIRSFFLNYELSVAVHDRETIEKLKAWYENLLEKSECGVIDDSLFRRMMSVLVRLFASEL
ncbi:MULTISPECIES: phospholipase D-like domain-containing protein [Crateriforma]|uniref:Putative cardiolipin synthase YwiE n=1 Tax=Crateriforma conspicua TaxID=2527996 RepID=A0A5C6FYA2_9PLAN|nr:MULTISPECIES: phospholipase D-like domain-containing protein [Crateriforma]TWU66605.1 putative cardiolipin synthase YwiE [Crateriforma conspicua]